MPIYYADSSALVKRHVNEVGSAWIKAILNQAEQTFTAQITVAEVYSAFNRRVREGTLGNVTYTTIITDFNALCANDYRLAELTTPILNRSRLLLERHRLRAYDVVQLATALDTNTRLLAAELAPLTFLSADDRLLAAADAEGLPVDNPNNH